MSEITKEERAIFLDAIIDLTKIIEDSPKHFEHYNDRGFAYYVLKEYDKAISDLSLSMKLCPTDPFANYIYNLILKEMSKESTSVSSFEIK